MTRLMLAMVRFMAVLPLPWVRGLGALLGMILYALVGTRRRVVLTNLGLCFLRGRKRKSAGARVRFL